MKSRFRQPLIELLTVSIVVGFLIVNLFRIVTNPNFIQLIPLTFQSTILVFYFYKHRYLATSIKVWSVLFVVGAALTVISLALGGFSEMPSSKLFWVAVDFIVGILLWLIASSEIELVPLQGLTENK